MGPAKGWVYEDFFGICNGPAVYWNESVEVYVTSKR